jgi:hypothetical protein
VIEVMALEMDEAVEGIWLLVRRGKMIDDK